MAANDPKATLTASASTVRFLSRRQFDPNTKGANHAPLTINKRRPQRGRLLSSLLCVRVTYKMLLDGLSF